jgi:hypothetical protein
MRIAFFYWMKDDPDRVRAVAPEHAAYWRDLALHRYLGGPFADRSGGLITLEVDSLGAGGGHHRRRSLRSGAAAGEFGGEAVDARIGPPKGMPPGHVVEGPTRAGDGGPRRERAGRCTGRASARGPGREESKRNERTGLGDRREYG